MYAASQRAWHRVTRETKSATQELKPIVDEWIVLLDKLDDVLTHDGNRHSVTPCLSPCDAGIHKTL